MKRELQQWVGSGWKDLPKRGRLRLPAIRFKYSADYMLRIGMEYLERTMAPVIAFANAGQRQSAERKKP